MMDSLQSTSEIDYNIYEDENEFFLHNINPMSKNTKNTSTEIKDNFLKYMEYILYSLILIVIIVTIIYFVALSFQ